MDRRSADEAWDALTSSPLTTTSTQYQLRPPLSTVTVSGKVLEQWQYKIANGGRIWYAPDPDEATSWLIEVSFSHPKKTQTRKRGRG